MLKNTQNILMNTFAAGVGLFLLLIFPLNAAAETISVRYQNTTFDVNASLTNGSVEHIAVDEDFTSVVLAVETGSEDGSLTITLPRALIDARNGDGTSDQQFIVVVGSSEVEYSEEGTTDTERMLTIGVPAGTERIEIVGTQVVPELPVPALVMAAAIAAVIASITLRARKTGNASTRLL